MTENAMIGARLRALRLEKKMTLKQLGEESGLSVGFLSQVERGLSSIAIDSLSALSKLLGASLSSFFAFESASAQDPVVHGFDLRSTPVSPQIIQYVLSHDVKGFSLLPRLFLLQPQGGPEEPLEMYSHAGEEFAYVLEGIVTVYLGGAKHTLHPGDSVQIHSHLPHNWTNLTSKPARLLSINHPNPFLPQAE